MYGSLGTPYFKFYDLRIATAITFAGQYAIQWIGNKLNTYLNNLLKTENEDYVIASDTDSAYLSLGKLVDQTIRTTKPNASTKEIIRFMDRICKEAIQPYIDKSYQELASYVNAYAQKMDMKREALCDVAIWTAKKRYILNVWDNEGVEYAKPEIKVSGLEVKKSSTPSSCRAKLEEAIELIVNGSEDDVIQFIDKFREEFKTLPEREIAFPRGVNGIAKYIKDPVHTPIHVRGSILYNRLLEENKLTKKYQPIREGEKIRFIYMKEPNTIRSNILAFKDSIPKELDLARWIDYNTQYDKAFLDPLKIILDAIGWKTEYKNTLAAFFGA